MKPITTDDMIAAQLREFPDSRIVTHDQAAWWPQEPIDDAVVPRVEGGTADYVSAMLVRVQLKVRQYEWLDVHFCKVHLRHPLIFFEWNWYPVLNRYMKRGCRWGMYDYEVAHDYPIKLSDMYRRPV